MVAVFFCRSVVVAACCCVGFGTLKVKLLASSARRGGATFDRLPVPDISIYYLLVLLYTVRLLLSEYKFLNRSRSCTHRQI